MDEQDDMPVDAGWLDQLETVDMQHEQEYGDA